jgi:hypothetical protein
LSLALLAAAVTPACHGAISGPGTTTSGSGGAGGAPATTAGPTTSPSVARRLSRSEFDATVRDLLGDSTNPASHFLAEDEYTPFDNDYTRQKPSAALIDALEATAGDIATRVLASAANRAKIVPCTPTGPGDAACFRQTIQQTGRRLFRRPLSDDEVTAYLTLQSFATENNPAVAHDFYTAVNLMLRSMLQDPEFLYRIEVGTPTADAGVLRLDSYELATRLAYLITGSAPDDRLLDLAKTDGLTDPAARRAEATRLLADPRAREQIHRFHAMWLGYRAIPGSAELLTAFNAETTALIDKVVFDSSPGSPYLTLFSSDQTYVNNLLADQYGLPRPNGGAGWVPYGATGRAGILSHGAVLAAFSKFSDTSPTQRGIFVQTRLLCNVVKPPPANVNVDQPPPATTSACKLDRYAAHRSTASCGACHNNLDPIGLGLEQYDITGKLRTHDDGHPECPVDGAGALPGSGSFNGPAELGRKLVESGKLEHCFLEHLLRYALGRGLYTGEDAAVDALATSFDGANQSLTDTLLAYVASERFALRQEDPTP